MLEENFAVMLAVPFQEVYFSFDIVLKNALPDVGDLGLTQCATPINVAAFNVNAVALGNAVVFDRRRGDKVMPLRCRLTRNRGAGGPNNVDKVHDLFECLFAAPLHL